MDLAARDNAEIKPAIPPPLGVTSDFTYRVGPLGIATNIAGPICIAITTLALTLRIATKVRVVGHFKWDDWFALGSWLIFVPWVALFIHVVSYDGGIHSWNVPETKVPYILEYIWILLLLWPVLMLCAQLSINIQIFNLFGGTRKGIVYWVTRVIIGVSIIIFGTNFFATLFGCQPIHKSWDTHIDGTCINTDSLTFLSALWNVVVDITVWILLIYTVWTLQIPRRKKIFISGIFVTAFFAPVFAICRLLYAIFTTTTHDRFYALMQLGLWSLAEASIYVLCGVMPLLPKFIQLVRSRHRRQTYDPTPNSVHRSTRFLQRRFTGHDQHSAHSHADPWLRPDEMTMKLTGIAGKTKGAKHFNGRDSRPYNSLNSSEINTVHAISDREAQALREEERDVVEKQIEPRGADFWLGTGIMKTVKIETESRPADSPEPRPSEAKEAWDK